MSEDPTFEETYRKYEFSGLVSLGMSFGEWILHMLRLAEAPAPKARSAPTRRDALPAD